MHLLYKVCRADNPQALCNDFKTDVHHETRAYDFVQDDALDDVKRFIAKTVDVNQPLSEREGVTWLYLAAEQGHTKAVRELLLHPLINPNKVRLSSGNSPLFVAAHHGHNEVVEALLGHPHIHVNEGSADGSISPLFIAAQEGREVIVEMLLRHKNIDVNRETSDSRVVPLCTAAQEGHDRIVDLLLSAAEINADHVTKDGATALSIACVHFHANVVQRLVRHLMSTGSIATNSLNLKKMFDRDETNIESDKEYCTAMQKLQCKPRKKSHAVMFHRSLHMPAMHQGSFHMPMMVSKETMASKETVPNIAPPQRSDFDNDDDFEHAKDLGLFAPTSMENTNLATVSPTALPRATSLVMATTETMARKKSASPFLLQRSDFDNDVDFEYAKELGFIVKDYPKAGPMQRLDFDSDADFEHAKELGLS